MVPRRIAFPKNCPICGNTMPIPVWKYCQDCEYRIRAKKNREALRKRRRFLLLKKKLNGKTT